MLVRSLPCCTPFTLCFQNLINPGYCWQELYNAGARKFGVVSLSAIGCIPLELLVSRSLDGSCNNDVNAEILRFNSALHVMIKDLQATYADAHFTFLDSFNIVYNIIQNPVSYGKWHFIKEPPDFS